MLRKIRYGRFQSPKTGIEVLLYCPSRKERQFVVGSVDGARQYESDGYKRIYDAEYWTPLPKKRKSKSNSHSVGLSED